MLAELRAAVHESEHNEAVLVAAEESESPQRIAATSEEWEAIRVHEREFIASTTDEAKESKVRALFVQQEVAAEADTMGVPESERMLVDSDAAVLVQWPPAARPAPLPLPRRPTTATAAVPAPPPELAPLPPAIEQARHARHGKLRGSHPAAPLAVPIPRSRALPASAASEPVVGTPASQTAHMAVLSHISPSTELRKLRDLEEAYERQAGAAAQLSAQEHEWLEPWPEAALPCLTRPGC